GDAEAVGSPKLPDPVDPGGDRVVPEAGRLGEHQDVELRALCRGDGRQREQRGHRHGKACQNGSLSHGEPPSQVVFLLPDEARRPVCVPLTPLPATPLGASQRYWRTIRRTPGGSYQANTRSSPDVVDP